VFAKKTGKDGADTTSPISYSTA